MRKFLLLTFLLLLSRNLLAENKYYVAVGSTISHFITGESNISYFINRGYFQSETGIILRVGKEIYSDSLSELSIGIGFSTRGSTIKQQLIIPNVSETRYLYWWDIHLRMAYLEIPILLKLKLPINKRFGFGPIFGYSFMCPVKDLTKLSKRRYGGEFTPDMETYHFTDYSFVRDSEFSKNSVKFIYYFGFQLKYTRYIFELSWAIDNQESYFFDHLSALNHKMGYINALVYIEF
ncbi:MAG: hypothetical protein GXO76_03435 [Calditrichaeota bacterium]|nr:hypothetical protein [Calditrichota bacterium]